MSEELKRLGALVVILLLVVAAGLLLPSRPAVQETESVTGRLPGIPVNGDAQETDVAAARKTLAVLPLTAMSNGPDDEYFSDGLSGEIIDALTQIPGLRVTPYTSAFHFRGHKTPSGEIADRLEVAHLVDGSVSRAGERLSVKARLLRASDGQLLWSETYEGRTADTFALLADIAEEIAIALNANLDEPLRLAMRHSGIGHVNALLEYQKGRAYFDRAPGDVNPVLMLRRASSHFEETVRLAPAYPDAYLHISELYAYILLSGARGELDGNITTDDILNAPERLRRNYDMAVRHAGEPLRVLARFDRALLLGDWSGLSVLADQALSASGCRPSRWISFASAAFRKTRALTNAYGETAACDPFRAESWINLTEAALWLGAPGAARASARSGLERVKNERLARAYIMALAADRRFSEAQQQTAALLRSDDERLMAGFTIAALKGDASAARLHQDDFLTRHGPNDAVSVVMEAQRGNRNEANRLAGLIDSRPFGYMSLLQAIYWCTCGAPFDLKATPVFAGKLSGSGLPWPPAAPLDYPMKDW